MINCRLLAAAFWLVAVMVWSVDGRLGRNLVTENTTPTRVSRLLWVPKRWKMILKMKNENALARRVNIVPLKMSSVTVPMKMTSANVKWSKRTTTEMPLTARKMLAIYRRRFPVNSGRPRSMNDVFRKRLIMITTKKSRRYLELTTRPRVTYQKYIANFTRSVDSPFEKLPNLSRMMLSFRQAPVYSLRPPRNESARRIPTFAWSCPTFGPLWYECTKPRNVFFYPRTASRSKCTGKFTLTVTTKSANSTRGHRQRCHSRGGGGRLKCSCTSPSTTCKWTFLGRKRVRCPSTMVTYPYAVYNRFCCYTCSFPTTTGCCTDPTSTCSKPTSTEKPVQCCTDPTSTPYNPELYLVTCYEITECTTMRPCKCYKVLEFTLVTRCRPQCTEPTSSCLPQTTTCFKVNRCSQGAKCKTAMSVTVSLKLIPTQPIIPCRCLTWVEEVTTCRTTGLTKATFCMMTMSTCSRERLNCCDQDDVRCKTTRACRTTHCACQYYKDTCEDCRDMINKPPFDSRYNLPCRERGKWEAWTTQFCPKCAADVCSTNFPNICWKRVTSCKAPGVMPAKCEHQWRRRRKKRHVSDLRPVSHSNYSRINDKNGLLQSAHVVIDSKNSH